MSVPVLCAGIGHRQLRQLRRSSANPKGILALITGSALRYAGEVPDFTCTELITRSEASAKIAAGATPNWKVRDKLEEVLSWSTARRITR